MAMLNHDGKSHPVFAEGTRLRVYFRESGPMDVNAIEESGIPVFGIPEDDEYQTGINSDWWVWDAEERWYDIVGYEVLGFE